jgi:hypothetical protein
MPMTTIAVMAVSITALAALAWIAGKALRTGLCPLCIGVAGTWAWMLAARYAGFAVDSLMLALLIGGSVTGIAYQLEARLPQGRSALLWKGLFLPAGFAAGYALVAGQWAVLAFAALALLVPAAMLLRPQRPPGSDAAAVEKLEERMKKCC